MKSGSKTICIALSPVGKHHHSLALIFLIIPALFLAGCAKGSTGNNTGNIPLADVVAGLYSNVDVPPHEVVELDSSNFEYFAFIPYNEGLSAVAADALVNITPHSVVVIRSENGDGAEIAEKVFSDADPNKWLCVGSEVKYVAYTNHYVVLIMSYESTADAITENFKSMAKELDDMGITVLKASNPRYEQFF